MLRSTRSRCIAQGRTPVKDLSTVVALTRLSRSLRPDISLCYAVKPVIYGSLATRIAGVPVRAAMITGIGSALSQRPGKRSALMRNLIRVLYAIALRGVRTIFFQNPDDQRTFTELGLIGRGSRLVRINGSGLDLKHYAPVPLPPGPVTFVMVGRLIRDKGVAEYVEAARRVRASRADCRFLLLGGLDVNPTSITVHELEELQAHGVVEYLGTTSDVRPVLAQAHVVVLPSYGEGMPRSVLEGMAMGRAILTTDVAGCRETVIAGRNGYLVPARDAAALAGAMTRMIEERDGLSDMGAESRAMAVDRFDVHAVNRVILEALGA